MYRNVAGQKITMYARNTSTGAPVTGDDPNMTPRVAIDGSGTPTVLSTTTVVEWSSAKCPGLYYIQPTAAETNGEDVAYYITSTTANVECYRLFSTYPASFSTQWISGGGGSVIIGDRTGMELASTGLNQILMRDLAAIPAFNAQVMDALSLLFMALRNKHITDSAALLDKICKNDGTVIGTAAISDIASVFQKDKFA